jgi:hypothetical protein
MRKVILTAATAGLVLASAAGSVFAQDEEVEYPNMRVVESWTCEYKEGKGRADLDKANAAWNEWMDKTGQNDYTALMATPYFFGEWPFDIGWIGVARDGHAFGEGTDRWINEGGEVGEMFDEVITCDTHSAWVSMIVDPSENDGNDEGDDTFVLSFSDCSIKDGHTFEDYMAATRQWNEYAAEHGFKQAGWVWFPVAGESADDYDFKFAGAEDDYRTMGANWQLYLDGHWQKSNEIFDDIVDCDVSRIYNATMLRRWEQED